MPRPTRVSVVIASVAAALITWPLTKLLAAAAPESPPASQPTSQPTTQPDVRTGRFQLTFTEKSPQSVTADICKRMGWLKVDSLKEFGKPMDYDPAKESYEVFVPASYTGAEPYGLFVWVSPGPRGDLPGQFYDVIDRHKLIAIGANGSGNERELWNRMAVALDAAYNMPKQFKIDPRRMYVSGASGGGKTSSRLAMLYPDVFNGGYYQIGLDFYEPLWVDKEEGRFYKQEFQRLSNAEFPPVRDRTRHVLMTGENDPNRLPTHLAYEEMKKDGFKHIIYLEQPGLGHAPPNAEWFEKGIVFLDESMDAATEPVAPKGKTAAKGKTPAPVAKKPTAPPATRPAAVATTKPAAPQEPEEVKMLKLAKLYVKNRLYDKARAKLKELMAAYPTTASAKEAAALQKEIGTE